MSELFCQKQSRREFLSCFGRYVFLGTLVSASGVLITKRKASSTYEEPVDISICRNCVFLSKCDQLPFDAIAKEQTKSLLVKKERVPDMERVSDGIVGVG
jgi:hypothetical protein